PLGKTLPPTAHSRGDVGHERHIKQQINDSAAPRIQIKPHTPYFFHQTGTTSQRQPNLAKKSHHHQPSLRIHASPSRLLPSAKPPNTTMPFSSSSPIGAVASQPLGPGPSAEASSSSSNGRISTLVQLPSPFLLPTTEKAVSATLASDMPCAGTWNAH